MTTDDPDRLRALVEALAPDAQVAVAEAAGEWVVTMARGEAGPFQVGRGATETEALERAQRGVIMALGLRYMVEALSSSIRSGAPIRLEGKGPLAGAPGATAQGDPPKTTLADRLGGFGWRLVFQSEPDGSYHWAVFDSSGAELVQDGSSDDWDGAKLDAILKLLPPSPEGLELA